MLARRFTIVCLLTALFGMLFSVLVDQNARGRGYRAVSEFASGQLQSAFSVEPASTASTMA